MFGAFWGGGGIRGIVPGPRRMGGIGRGSPGCGAPACGMGGGFGGCGRGSGCSFAPRRSIVYLILNVLSGSR